jgi:cytochrome c peroxidase
MLATSSSSTTTPVKQPFRRVAIILFGLLLATVVWWLLRPQPAPVIKVRATYETQQTALDSALARLERAVDTRQPGPAIQTAFREARIAYKQIEWLTAYYSPLTTKALNGANILTVDDDYRTVTPQGFQVLEELVFPEYDPANRADALQQLGMMRINAKRLRQLAEGNTLTDSHIFDALRLEIFRVITLGITGFDSPVAFQSLPETMAALEGVRAQLANYPIADKNPGLAAKLNTAFAGAIAMLKTSRDFDSFDRLTFIRDHANPLSSLLFDAQNALGIKVFTESRLLSPSARTLTEAGVFNPNFFVNSTDNVATTDKIALGKMLFYDPILSGKSGRTCATCHQPNRDFTDGEAKSLATGFGGRRIARNSPTLWNTALQAVQFADSRVVFLEDQASDVIQNQDEMHGSLPEAVKALAANPRYATLFAKTYKTGVTEPNLKNAIASYMRSLVNLDSRFDKHLRGEKSPQKAMLTNDEKLGFNIFMGKGKCATCHFFPLFNGTVPPAFLETESEVIGTPASANGKQVDADPGKFVVTKNAVHQHAFKTPTVRFAAKTAPYMHNGVYQTLDEVVDFYNKGGGNGLGFQLDNQTLPFDKLNLTEAEKRGLVAFMKGL